MAYMTDAEAERLDEYYTKNTIIPEGGKVGGLDRLRASLRPGEVLFTESFSDTDEDHQAEIFGRKKEVEDREFATAVSA